MLKSFRFPLLETPGDGSGGGPAAVPATPTTPTTPVAATPQSAATTAIPSAPAEDRSGWIPPYRVREMREADLRNAQSQFEAREQRAMQEAEQYRRQVLALTGVQPPPNPEIAAVRSQFGELYPGLSKLEAQSAQLEALLERAGDLESQSDHYWTSYGRQSMDRLFEQASKSTGAPLTDDGKRVLHSAFTGFVSSSPELTARYANDPTLVTDFWNAFSSNFIDPARRVASAAVAGRVPGALPQDTPGGIPHVTPGQKPQSLDERANAGWALYNQNKKA